MTSLECRPVTELDSEVRELLDRWAAGPAKPVSELTAQAVREDDLAVLEASLLTGCGRPPTRRIA
jgi:hypothetical protein